jgi:hypothetical protein
MTKVTRLPEDGGCYELRLITRAISFLALLTGVLYLRVIAGELLAGLRGDRPSAAGLLLFLFLLLGVGGLLLSWRREGLGGMIALAGGFGLAAVDYRLLGQHPWLRTLLYSSPFVVAGGLCLICAWRVRAHPA